MQYWCEVLYCRQFSIVQHAIYREFRISIIKIKHTILQWSSSICVNGNWWWIWFAHSATTWNYNFCECIQTHWIYALCAAIINMHELNCFILLNEYPEMNNYKLKCGCCYALHLINLATAYSTPAACLHTHFSFSSDIHAHPHKNNLRRKAWSGQQKLHDRKI